MFLFLIKDKSQTAELWEKLNFGNKDQNVKFRKLMGIKVSLTMVFHLDASVKSWIDRRYI